jgi:hypothetical protein
MNYTLELADSEDREAEEVLTNLRIKGVVLDLIQLRSAAEEIEKRLGSGTFSTRYRTLKVEPVPGIRRIKFALSNIGVPTETDDVQLWPGSRER